MIRDAEHVVGGYNFFNEKTVKRLRYFIIEYIFVKLILK